MCAQTVNTVTGPIDVNELGKTLMHEHVILDFPGWEANTLREPPSEQEMLAIGQEKIAGLQERGFKSLLDPCPNDLGRDVEFSARLSDLTGFNIICATGLYKEALGGAPYWKFRAKFGKGAGEIAELFIKELTVGIKTTGIKAGIIKVATGEGKVTEYERTVMEAAAIAHRETGVPITTHTEKGTMGEEQFRILTNLGVPPHKIIIGHSCGTNDYGHHMRLIGGGAYLGFDRFGLSPEFPDKWRIQSLLKLLQSGAEQRIVIGHDSCWCSRGGVVPDDVLAALGTETFFNPNHFSDHVIPQLLEGGATHEQIDQLLIDNPRRYFTGEPVPLLDV